MRKTELWVAEDGPREKLAELGASSLTDIEVIAVLLGTGSVGNDVLDTAKKLLKVAENNLIRLAALSIDDMINVEGVGYAKALRLKAAVEFARRAPFEQIDTNPKVLTSEVAFKALAPNLGDLRHEEFWALYLNRHSKMIRKTKISQGGLTSTLVDPRKVFKLALREDACSLIVAHNHPSGNLTPSQADIDLTKKLSAAGKLLDIQLVDHLIISGNNYCSFADSGLL